LEPKKACFIDETGFAFIKKLYEKLKNMAAVIFSFLLLKQQIFGHFRQLFLIYPQFLRLVSPPVLAEDSLSVFGVVAF
jgi:hypothetical protein